MSTGAVRVATCGARGRARRVFGCLALPGSKKRTFLAREKACWGHVPTRSTRDEHPRRREQHSALDPWESTWENTNWGQGGLGFRGVARPRTPARRRFAKGWVYFPESLARWCSTSHYLPQVQGARPTLRSLVLGSITGRPRSSQLSPPRRAALRAAQSAPFLYGRKF